MLSALYHLNGAFAEKSGLFTPPQEPRDPVTRTLSPKTRRVWILSTVQVRRTFESAAPAHTAYQLAAPVSGRLTCELAAPERVGYQQAALVSEGISPAASVSSSRWAAPRMWAPPCRMMIGSAWRRCVASIFWTPTKRIASLLLRRPAPRYSRFVTVCVWGACGAPRQ